jgi:hypothetical protein
VVAQKGPFMVVRFRDGPGVGWVFVEGLGVWGKRVRESFTWRL